MTHFVLAVVRLHRWSSGYSFIGSINDIYKDEIEASFYGDAQQLVSKDDLIGCGRTILATLHGAGVSSSTFTDSDDDDDIEEEVFAQKIDDLEFLDKDMDESLDPIALKRRFSHEKINTLKSITSPTNKYTQRSSIVQTRGSIVQSSQSIRHSIRSTNGIPRFSIGPRRSNGNLLQRDSITTILCGRQDLETSGIYFHLPKTHALSRKFCGIAIIDPKFQSGYSVQQSVRILLLLSTVPWQAHLKQKLEQLGSEYFRQDERNASIEPLELFYTSLTTTMELAELPYLELYMELPMIQLLKGLGGKDLLMILRIILLEGRVVIYSYNPSLASAMTLAFLGYLSGVLLLSVEDLSPRQIELALYRLRKYGMPFHLFSETFTTQPCFVTTEQKSILSSKGFLAGTSNPLLLKHPDAGLDVIVDVDTYQVVAFSTEMIQAAMHVGPRTEGFLDALHEKFGRVQNDSLSSPTYISRRTSIPWAPSMPDTNNQSDIDWLVQHFQSYWEQFLSTVNDSTSNDGKLEVTNLHNSQEVQQVLRRPSQFSLFGSETEPLFVEYGRGWFNMWKETTNYKHWNKAHRIEKKQRHLSVGESPSKDASLETDLSVLDFNGHMQFRYANGDEYEGDFVQGKRHGFGVYLQFATKTKYEGDWYDDVRHGKGILSSKLNGYIYDGEWQNNLRTGHGYSAIKNVENYTGQWLENNFHGMGTLVNADDDVYEGEWVHGVKQGAGKLTVSSSSSHYRDKTLQFAFGGLLEYIGEFSKDVFHGQGKARYVNGNEYSGDFVDGKRHGNGILVYPNGDKYEGQWWKQFRHGEGSFYSKASGITRESTWKKDNEIDGLSLIYFQNGDKYSGMCCGGRPWGEGTCKYTNGSTFSGMWIDGLRNGHGIFIDAKGVIMEGEWKNDCLVHQTPRTNPLSEISLDGSAAHQAPPSPTRRRRSSTLNPEDGNHRVVYDNGDSYEGDFYGGKRHGFGIFIERATGNMYEGEWENNIRSGNGVLTSGLKDFIYDGEWKDDVRHGYGHCVIRNCETYSGEWKDNQFHGMGKYIDAENQVYDGEFYNGKKHGVGKQFVAGNPEQQYCGEWKMGYREGIGSIVYEDKSSYSGSWKLGVRDGEGTYISANGDKYVGQWRKDMKDGAGVFTCSDGTIQEGMWAGDKPLDGEWTIQYPDGSKYTGACINGRPYGIGVCKYSNGDVYDGEWMHGVRQGTGKAFFANGESFIGEWEGNHVALHGKGKLTLANGTTNVYAT